tara:strand:+ start:121 stop:726 length:606 start_codon:yes stop_codon:yes gene_type:complete
MKTQMIEFENLLETFKSKIDTKEFKKLQVDFDKSDTIFFIGNGGVHSVATHAASDVSRLTSKKCYSLDSASYLTSIANDYSYNNIFIRWLEDYAVEGSNSMVIGFSGSGNSKNVISCLTLATDKYNFKTNLISGQKSAFLPDYIDQVCFDNKYFHVHEILCMLTFYQLIHGTGNSCPTIKDEIVRKGAHAESYRTTKYKEI